MINYLKSEFYRLLRSKGSYLFIVICSLLVMSANIVLAAVKHSDPKFNYATTEVAFSFYYTSFTIIFILCLTVVSIVFGNEYSNHTMKNSISYGISRGGLYFGKLTAELIYAIIAFLIISGLYIASAYLLLENSGIGHLQLMLKATIAALPLLFYAIAVSNCFLFIFDSNGSAIGSTIGVMIAFPIICNYLAIKFHLFAELAKILPWNLVNKLDFDIEKFQLIFPWEGNDGYFRYWIYGLSWMLLFAVLGFYVYRKKEIK
jgi:ABC-2 type transport system permease protein